MINKNMKLTSTFIKDEDQLEKTMIDDTNSLMSYLHGDCHTLALTLSELLNYKIILLIEYDDDIKTNALVHAFNVTNVSSQTYYIDARGVTKNIDDILNSFDMWDEPDIYHWNYGEAYQILQSMGINYNNSEFLNKYLLKNINKYKI